MTKVNFLNNIQPHKSWNNFLDHNILTLLSNIESYLKNEEYYPNQNDVLRFLNNDLNNVKVVVLGIDPYHSSFTTSTGTKDCVATGRSFEPKNVEYFTKNIDKHH